MATVNEMQHVQAKKCCRRSLPAGTSSKRSKNVLPTSQQKRVMDDHLTMQKTMSESHTSDVLSSGRVNRPSQRFVPQPASSLSPVVATSSNVEVAQYEQKHEVTDSVFNNTGSALNKTHIQQGATIDDQTTNCSSESLIANSVSAASGSALLRTFKAKRFRKSINKGTNIQHTSTSTKSSAGIKYSNTAVSRLVAKDSTPTDSNLFRSTSDLVESVRQSGSLNVSDHKSKNRKRKFFDSTCLTSSVGLRRKKCLLQSKTADLKTSSDNVTGGMFELTVDDTATASIKESASPDNAKLLGDKTSDNKTASASRRHLKIKHSTITVTLAPKSSCSHSLATSAQPNMKSDVKPEKASETLPHGVLVFRRQSDNSECWELSSAKDGKNIDNREDAPRKKLRTASSHQLIAKTRAGESSFTRVSKWQRMRHASVDNVTKLISKSGAGDPYKFDVSMQDANILPNMSRHFNVPSIHSMTRRSSKKRPKQKWQGSISANVWQTEFPSIPSVIWDWKGRRDGKPHLFRPVCDKSTLISRGWEEYVDVFDDFIYWSGRRNYHKPTNQKNGFIDKLLHEKMNHTASTASSEKSKEKGSSCFKYDSHKTPGIKRESHAVSRKMKKQISLNSATLSEHSIDSSLKQAQHETKANGDKETSRTRGKSNSHWYLYARNSGIQKLGLYSGRKKKAIKTSSSLLELCRPCSVVLVDVSKCFQLLSNPSHMLSSSSQRNWDIGTPLKQSWSHSSGSHADIQSTSLCGETTDSTMNTVSHVLTYSDTAMNIMSSTSTAITVNNSVSMDCTFHVSNDLPFATYDSNRENLDLQLNQSDAVDADNITSPLDRCPSLEKITNSKTSDNEEESNCDCPLLERITSTVSSTSQSSDLFGAALRTYSKASKKLLKKNITSGSSNATEFLAQQNFDSWKKATPLVASYNMESSGDRNTTCTKSVDHPDRVAENNECSSSNNPDEKISTGLPDEKLVADNADKQLCGINADEPSVAREESDGLNFAESAVVSRGPELRNDNSKVDAWLSLLVEQVIAPISSEQISSAFCSNAMSECPDVCNKQEAVSGPSEIPSFEVLSEQHEEEKKQEVTESSDSDIVYVSGRTEQKQLVDAGESSNMTYDEKIKLPVRNVWQEMELLRSTGVRQSSESTPRSYSTASSPISLFDQHCKITANKQQTDFSLVHFTDVLTLPSQSFMLSGRISRHSHDTVDENNWDGENELLNLSSADDSVKKLTDEDDADQLNEQTAVTQDEVQPVGEEVDETVESPHNDFIDDNSSEHATEGQCNNMCRNAGTNIKDGDREINVEAAETLTSEGLPFNVSTAACDEIEKLTTQVSDTCISSIYISVTNECIWEKHISNTPDEERENAVDELQDMKTSPKIEEGSDAISVSHEGELENISLIESEKRNELPKLSYECFMETSAGSVCDSVELPCESKPLPVSAECVNEQIVDETSETTEMKETCEHSVKQNVTDICEIVEVKRSVMEINKLSTEERLAASTTIKDQTSDADVTSQQEHHGPEVELSGIKSERNLSEEYNEDLTKYILLPMGNSQLSSIREVSTVTLSSVWKKDSSTSSVYCSTFSSPSKVAVGQADGSMTSSVVCDSVSVDDDVQPSNSEELQCYDIEPITATCGILFPNEQINDNSNNEQGIVNISDNEEAVNEILVNKTENIEQVDEIAVLTENGSSEDCGTLQQVENLTLDVDSTFIIPSVVEKVSQKNVSDMNSVNNQHCDEALLGILSQDTENTACETYGVESANVLVTDDKKQIEVTSSSSRCVLPYDGLVLNAMSDHQQQLVNVCDRNTDKENESITSIPSGDALDHADISSGIESVNIYARSDPYCEETSASPAVTIDTMETEVSISVLPLSSELTSDSIDENEQCKSTEEGVVTDNIIANNTVVKKPTANIRYQENDHDSIIHIQQVLTMIETGPEQSTVIGHTQMEQSKPTVLEVADTGQWLCSDVVRKTVYQQSAELVQERGPAANVSETEQKQLSEVGQEQEEQSDYTKEEQSENEQDRGAVIKIVETEQKQLSEAAQLVDVEAAETKQEQLEAENENACNVEEPETEQKPEAEQEWTALAENTKSEEMQENVVETAETEEVQFPNSELERGALVKTRQKHPEEPEKERVALVQITECEQRRDVKKLAEIDEKQLFETVELKESVINIAVADQVLPEAKQELVTLMETGEPEEEQTELDHKDEDVGEIVKIEQEILTLAKHIDVEQEQPNHEQATVIHMARTEQQAAPEHLSTTMKLDCVMQDETIMTNAEQVINFTEEPVAVLNQMAGVEPDENEYELSPVAEKCEQELLMDAEQLAENEVQSAVEFSLKSEEEQQNEGIMTNIAKQTFSQLTEKLGESTTIDEVCKDETLLESFMYQNKEQLKKQDEQKTVFVDTSLTSIECSNNESLLSYGNTVSPLTRDINLPGESIDTQKLCGVEEIQPHAGQINACNLDVLVNDEPDCNPRLGPLENEYMPPSNITAHVKYEIVNPELGCFENTESVCEETANEDIMKPSERGEEARKLQYDSKLTSDAFSGGCIKSELNDTYVSSIEAPVISHTNEVVCNKILDQPKDWTCDNESSNVDTEDFQSLTVAKQEHDGVIQSPSESYTSRRIDATNTLASKINQFYEPYSEVERAAEERIQNIKRNELQQVSFGDVESKVDYHDRNSQLSYTQANELRSLVWTNRPEPDDSKHLTTATSSDIGKQCLYMPASDRKNVSLLNYENKCQGMIKQICEDEGVTCLADAQDKQVCDDGRIDDYGKVITMRIRDVSMPELSNDANETGFVLNEQISGDEKTSVMTNDVNANSLSSQHTYSTRNSVQLADLISKSNVSGFLLNETDNNATPSLLSNQFINNSEYADNMTNVGIDSAATSSEPTRSGELDLSSCDKWISSIETGSAQPGVCSNKIVAYSCHICKRSFTVQELAREHMMRIHHITIRSDCYHTETQQRHEYHKDNILATNSETVPESRTTRMRGIHVGSRVTPPSAATGELLSLNQSSCLPLSIDQMSNDRKTHSRLTSPDTRIKPSAAQTGIEPAVSAVEPVAPVIPDRESFVSVGAASSFGGCAAQVNTMTSQSHPIAFSQNDDDVIICRIEKPVRPQHRQLASDTVLQGKYMPLMATNVQHRQQSATVHKPGGMNEVYMASGPMSDQPRMSDRRAATSVPGPLYGLASDQLSDARTASLQKASERFIANSLQRDALGILSQHQPSTRVPIGSIGDRYSFGDQFGQSTDQYQTQKDMSRILDRYSSREKQQMIDNFIPEMQQRTSQHSVVRPPNIQTRFQHSASIANPAAYELQTGNVQSRTDRYTVPGMPYEMPSVGRVAFNPSHATKSGMKTSVIRQPLAKMSAVTSTIAMTIVAPHSSSSSNVCRINPLRPPQIPNGQQLNYPSVSHRSHLIELPDSAYPPEYETNAVTTAAIRRPIMSTATNSCDTNRGSFSTSLESQYAASLANIRVSRRVNAAAVTPMPSTNRQSLQSPPVLVPISGLNLVTSRSSELHDPSMYQPGVIDLTYRTTPPAAHSHVKSVDRLGRPASGCDLIADKSDYATSVTPRHHQALLTPPPAHIKRNVAASRMDTGRCVIIPLPTNVDIVDQPTTMSFQRQHGVTRHARMVPSRESTPVPTPAHMQAMSVLPVARIPDCDGMIPRPAHSSRH